LRCEKSFDDVFYFGSFFIHQHHHNNDLLMLCMFWHMFV
jgi:hypothetical protein